MALGALRLAVVTPMADEAESCERFVTAVLAQCAPFREARLFVVLDRASTALTREKIERLAAAQPALEPIWAPENRHVADAYLRGFRAALDGGFDWVLEIDAGFSHDPGEMPRLFAAMAAGRDCVFGSRVLPGAASLETPLARRLVSRCGTWLANLLLGTRGSDMTSGYELFGRRALEQALARPPISRGHFLQTELRARCRGLDWVEVPITYRAPSPRLGPAGVGGALISLGRLFLRRLRGTL